MQRFFLVFFLAVMGAFPARALPPLSFEDFSSLDYKALDPYITDYFKRYPGQKGSEAIVRKFFESNPPVTMMPALQKQTPLFYDGVKAKATAPRAGKPGSAYTLDDFLKLPDSEHKDLANLVGPYLHALLTDKDSKDGLQELVHKENRALEVAFMLVQMRAQQSTAEAFSGDLSQIMIGLAQVRQAADRN